MSTTDGRQETEHYTNITSPWMCQYNYNLSKAIESLSPQERYLICCGIIGKDKTDELLKDLAKHPLKWKLKRLKRKCFR